MQGQNSVWIKTFTH